MLVGKALKNALEFLESLGYKSGDIRDDLDAAISTLEVTTNALELEVEPMCYETNYHIYSDQSANCVFCGADSQEAGQPCQGGK